MARAKTAFTVTTKGTFLGVKVNTTSPMFARLIKNASYTSRDHFLKDVMPVMEARFEELVPKYRDQLVRGATAFGQDPLVNVQGGATAEGLGSYESYAHGSHNPHKQIPNPLTRLVSEKGMKVSLRKVRDRFELKSEFKKKRTAYINFHNNMPKVPKPETVARRFDQTCLPFIREGLFGELTEIYAANASYSMAYTLAKYLEDREATRKKVGL